MGRVLAAICAVLAAGCASSGAGPQNEAAATRIRDGMARLGASEDRGDCFARRVSGALDDAAAEEAARLVESAEDRDGMREGVLSASAPVRRAFVGANFGCSLFN